MLCMFVMIAVFLCETLLLIHNKPLKHIWNKCVLRWNHGTMLQSFVMLSVDKHISVGIVAVAVACMVFLCKALLALNSLLQDHVGRV